MKAGGKINKNQTGFRRGHSTMDQLVKLVQSIAVGLEDSRCLRTVLCLLDFRVAYDRVWHDGLTAKMARLGLPGCVTR